MIISFNKTTFNCVKQSWLIMIKIMIMLDVVLVLRPKNQTRVSKDNKPNIIKLWEEWEITNQIIIIL